MAVVEIREYPDSGTAWTFPEELAETLDCPEMKAAWERLTPGMRRGMLLGGQRQSCAPTARNAGGTAAPLRGDFQVGQGRKG